MPLFRVTFEVDTDCDSSMVLAAFDERVGELLDNGYGTKMEVDADSVSIEVIPEQG